MTMELTTFEEAQSMIFRDAELDAAVSLVDRLDFTMLKRKLADEQKWNEDHCAEVESLYKMFLALTLRYPDKKICPNGPMDTFWHAHILDTRAYASDCEMVFGGYLHHFPYFGMRGPEDAAALADAFNSSVELFVVHFGFDPTAGDTQARSCSSQVCP